MKHILSKSLHALILLLSAMLLITMIGCDSGSESSTPLGIQGVAQKGPFIKGSRVFIQELDANLVPTGIAYETTTTDDSGSFDLASSLSANLVEVSITGYYYNEVTGQLSAGPQTLRMISDLSQNGATNVNVLTQLSVARVRKLVAGGMSLADANSQAKTEVLALFNIDPALITENFEDLNLANAGVANASLLYASAVLLQDRTEAETALLLAELELDLEENGIVDNPLLSQQVDQGLSSVNMTAILGNLTQYYVGIGETIDPPDVVTFEREMDVTPPILESINPADGAIGVAVDSSVELTFSEEIDPNSFAGNILLRDISGAIDCAISSHGRNVTLTPMARMAYSSYYTIEVKSSLLDMSGNAMENDHISSFTTEQAPDLIAPFLNATTPLDGAVDVQIGTVMELVFSEDLDPASLAGAITLSDGSQSLAFVTELQGATLRLTPVVQLTNGQTYRLTISQQITDMAKNQLDRVYEITFTTELAPDLTPPFLTATTPLDGAVEVKIGTVMELVFSEDIDPASLAGAINLSDGSQSLAFVTDLQGANLRLAPVAQFTMGQTYRLTISQLITDMAKNPLDQVYEISFTTEQPVLPSCGLKVTAVNPGEDQNATSIHRALTLHFNMELDRTSLHQDSLWLYGPDGIVHGRISVDDEVISFKPFKDLRYATLYELHLTDVKSESGEGLCGEVFFYFTTKSKSGKKRDHEDH